MFFRSVLSLITFIAYGFSCLVSIKENQENVHSADNDEGHPVDDGVDNDGGHEAQGEDDENSHLRVLADSRLLKMIDCVN